MAFDLPLPKQLAMAGWKVKIRDKELLEAPHLTIIHKTEAWRIGLRDGAFLDSGRWKDFPEALHEAVLEHWDRLCGEWDAAHPNNPVSGKEVSDDDDAS